MKNNLLKASGLVIFSLSLACANQTYTTQDIYDNMCAKCHGDKAQGGAKGGVQLNHYSLNELETTLYSLENDGYQSSGSHNEVMKANLKAIKKKGMHYKPEDMAKYIYTSFNPDAKKPKKTSAMFSKYSTEDIFVQMCAKCHGNKAQGGVKGGIPLNDFSLHELETTLISLEGDGYQSSGNHNEVMKANLDAIKRKGMKYHPKDMANYIYYNFNVNLKK